MRKGFADIKLDLVAKKLEDLELLCGKDALTQIENDNFKIAWDKLYNSCPWATIYQSREFVSTWFYIYHKEFLPIIILSHNNNALNGLLLLAKHNKYIYGAGGDQAEYQVWLSSIAESNMFMRNSFLLLKNKFPHHKIHLKYLPANLPPLNSKEYSFWQNKLFIQKHRQPIITINDDLIKNELKKKNKREKLNRLKKLGNLEFQRISDVDTFIKIFDELSSHFDLRKGAMFNRFFFHNNPKRKVFLIELFKKNLLHATVLKLNEEIIASNIGTLGKTMVHLQGINTHLPAYARYSPGILHFLMLCLHLKEEEIPIFDLTPGEDSYKDSLATDYLSVYELRYSNSLNYILQNCRLSLVTFSKKNFSKFGFKTANLKNVKTQAQRFIENISLYKKNGFQKFVKQLKSKDTIEIYLSQDALSTSTRSDTLKIKKNNISDLLKFDPLHSHFTRRHFLKEAVRRMEMGEYPITWTEKDILIGCAWIHKHTFSTNNSETGILEIGGCYYHPKSGNQMEAYILEIVRLASSDNFPEKIKFSISVSEKKIIKALYSIVSNKT